MKVLRQTPDFLSMRLDPPEMLRSITAALVFFAVPGIIFGIALRSWQGVLFAVGMVPVLGTCWGIAYFLLRPHYQYEFDKTLGQLRVLPLSVSAMLRSTPPAIFPLADVQEVTVHTEVYTRGQRLGRVHVILRTVIVPVPDVMHARSRQEDDAKLIADFLGVPLKLPPDSLATG